MLTNVLRSWPLIGLLFCFTGLSACEDEAVDIEVERAAEPCRTLTHRDAPYTVCSFQISDDIRLFHSDALGEPFRQFDTLSREIAEQNQTLIFAMNGGMYHEDRSPVGFYRDQFGDKARLNLNDGPGNFHLKPNGVFWLRQDRAGVTESTAYADADPNPIFATQSGPMLVIDGDIHPEINPDGVSRKRRNGVGVSVDGQTVHFGISDSAVTFYDFASLFRDELDAPNALFLEGQVSRVYAPGIGRNEIGADLGPIVGVIE